MPLWPNLPHLDDDYVYRFVVFMLPLIGEGRGITMKSIKVVAMSVAGLMLVVQQAHAGIGPVNVPEMDGAGAIIAIGLAVGLVALIREKFFHK